MAKELYWYESFSKSRGNMPALYDYQRELLSFEANLFPDNDCADNAEYVTGGIAREWAGAVLSFLGSLPIGAMTYTQDRKEAGLFIVGIAYVEEKHRHHGIWKKMSSLVEAEAKAVGAKRMVRNISLDSLFLISSLKKMGYRRDPEASNYPKDLVKYF